MTSVNGGNDVVAKKVRKTSLEACSQKSSDGEAKTLRRVRSDFLAPSSTTFTAEFLTDEKNHSPKKKTMNLDLPDSALLKAGNSAKGQTKKPPSGRRRKSSIHQGLMLDVAALHELRMKQESDDKISICSSMHSIKTSPSPDLSLANKRSDQSRLSPSLHVTNSPDTEDRVSFGEASDTSSVYHSSIMYTTEEGPRLLGHLLEDTRKTRERYNRRMSSPIIHSMKHQLLQDSSNTKTKVAAFPDEGRRHSSQDVPNMLSFELAALPTKSKFYSTQEDLTATSTPTQPAPTLRRGSQDPPAKEGMLTARMKDFRGSIDSQTQGKQQQDSNKELADQNCHSNFGIILSVICFVLFLWYLGMACSKFIKSALSFESFSKIPSADLGSVHEVIVYITAGDQAGAST